LMAIPTEHLATLTASGLNPAALCLWIRPQLSLPEPRREPSMHRSVRLKRGCCDHRLESSCQLMARLGYATISTTTLVMAPG